METKLSTNNSKYTGRFKPGQSGIPAGRGPGTKNQFTTLKSAFIDAFEQLGGVENLVEWARCNQNEFYRMLARLMPREVHANAGVSLIKCFREIVGQEDKPDTR